MTNWEVVGAVGQALFFGRVLVQWLASERAKRSANPPLFWWLSLGASLLLASATMGLAEWILLPGYLVNGAIYARNIALGRSLTLAGSSATEDSSSKAGVVSRASNSGLGPVPAALLALAASGALIFWGFEQSDWESGVAWGWLAVGLCGQLIWSTRFILQWWLSEREGRSHFPMAFWWLSLIGSLLNLAYTLQLETPIFWIGFITAWFVPLRNLMLEHRHRRALA